MKRRSTILLALVTSIFMACSSGGGDPKAVTKKFYEAMKTMNMDEAAKYATKESKNMLDLMKMGMSFAAANQDSIKAEMAKLKVDFSEPVINGDEATVTVTVDGKDKTEFKLKKEEGQWKVAFDKNTLMKTGMEKAQQNGADPAELQEAQKALESLQNPDSLQKVMEKAGDAMKEAQKAVDSATKK
jgi:nitrogen fixation protein FixH